MPSRVDVESKCNDGKADINGFVYPDGSFLDYLPLKKGSDEDGYLDCCPNPNCNSADDLPDAHDCVWIDWTSRDGYKFKLNAPYCSNKRPFLCSGPQIHDTECGNLDTGLYACSGKRCSVSGFFFFLRNVSSGPRFSFDRPSRNGCRLESGGSTPPPSGFGLPSDSLQL